MDPSRPTRSILGEMTLRSVAATTGLDWKLGHDSYSAINAPTRGDRTRLPHDRAVAKPFPSFSALPLPDAHPESANSTYHLWQCRPLPSRPHIQPMCAAFL